MKNFSFLIILSTFALMSCSKIDQAYEERDKGNFAKAEFIIKSIDKKDSEYKHRSIALNSIRTARSIALDSIRTARMATTKDEDERLYRQGWEEYYLYDLDEIAKQTFSKISYLENVNDSVFIILDAINKKKATQESAKLSEQQKRDEAFRLELTQQRKKQETKFNLAQQKQTQMLSHFSRWDGSHRNLEKYIKSNLKDPSSYDHTKTSFRGYDDYYIVTSTYRAKNSFGALVLENIKAKIDYDGNLLKIY